MEEIECVVLWIILSCMDIELEALFTGGFEEN